MSPLTRRMTRIDPVTDPLPVHTLALLGGWGVVALEPQGGLGDPPCSQLSAAVSQLAADAKKKRKGGK